MERVGSVQFGLRNHRYSACSPVHTLLLIEVWLTYNLMLLWDDLVFLYTPFKVIVKCWEYKAYSLYCTLHVVSYFRPISLYLSIPFAYLAPPLPLSPLVTAGLFSISVSLFLLHSLFYFLDSTCKWKDSICFSLTHFTKHNTLQVHPFCYIWKVFILFYGWVIFHYIFMCYIFFTHSSVDTHWGCFHILAVVNNAAVNIGVHIFSN